jgi:hypothetical protein
MTPEAWLLTFRWQHVALTESLRQLPEFPLMLRVRANQGIAGLSKQPL